MSRLDITFLPTQCAMGSAPGQVIAVAVGMAVGEAGSGVAVAAAPPAVAVAGTTVTLAGGRVANFGVAGAAAVLVMRPILPYALAFAAGAMIYVVVEELVPESQADKEADIATIGTMLGFTVMMVLDVALG